MLIESKGIHTDNFYLPPFALDKGEWVVLGLFGGEHFYHTSMFLKDIFCGTKNHQDVAVHKPLSYAEHIREPEFRRLFYPVSVGEYLKQKANLNSTYASKIYELQRITKRTKVNKLAGNPRRLLSIYATLSHTNNILFDVMGQDPSGAETTFSVIKEVVKNGGAAILLDNFNEMNIDCTRYVELQWKKG